MFQAEGKKVLSISFHFGAIKNTTINSLWPSDKEQGTESTLELKNWDNIGSGNGLLPDGTKPLPEPMLTYHQ